MCVLSIGEAFFTHIATSDALNSRALGDLWDLLAAENFFLHHARYE
jgi:hypothetical protein